MGLMQLMPSTAERFRVADPFNPAQNIAAGAQYLKQLLGRFNGNIRLALAAFNAGPAKVDTDSPEVPEIPETQQYVERILSLLNAETPQVQVLP